MPRCVRVASRRSPSAVAVPASVPQRTARDAAAGRARKRRARSSRVVLHVRHKPPTQGNPRTRQYSRAFWSAEWPPMSVMSRTTVASRGGQNSRGWSQWPQTRSRRGAGARRRAEALPSTRRRLRSRLRGRRCRRGGGAPHRRRSRRVGPAGAPMDTSDSPSGGGREWQVQSVHPTHRPRRADGCGGRAVEPRTRRMGWLMLRSPRTRTQRRRPRAAGNDSSRAGVSAGGSGGRHAHPTTPARVR